MSAGENQIVVYQPNETIRLGVRLENETEKELAEVALTGLEAA